jgi:hypothetical protein
MTTLMQIDEFMMWMTELGDAPVPDGWTIMLVPVLKQMFGRMLPHPEQYTGWLIREEIKDEIISGC